MPGRWVQDPGDVHELYEVYRKGYEPLSVRNSACFETYRRAYYYAKKDAFGRKELRPAFEAVEKLEDVKDEILSC